MYPAVNRHSTPALPEAIAEGLQQIRNCFPVIGRALDRYGESSLEDYVDSLFVDAPDRAQDPQDFVQAYGRRVSGLLGPDIAVQAMAQLAQAPVVLTTHHHGLDTFAQSLQTNLLFSLRARADGQTPRVIPVAACGSVPLNNLTYPRGLLVYAAGGTARAGGALKLPLFPDRYKRRMVNTTEAFTGDMLDRLARRIRSKPVTEAVAPRLARALLGMVESEFRQVLERRFDSYSRQASLLNAGLWRRIHREPAHAPALVYLELEDLAVELLQRDLAEPGSLASVLLFDPDVRGPLFDLLDGVSGCWDQARLGDYAAGPEPVAGDGIGTAFFWGLDEAGRRLPLALRETGPGAWRLEGRDPGGATRSLPLTAAALAEAMAARRVIPSLFTCYMLLALARGVTCVGGYYQAAYLPRMQSGVVAALAAGGDRHAGLARKVAAAWTDKYLSGMQTITATHGGRVVPAGLGEIAACGGLDAAQFDSMRGVRVRDAHIASLGDTLHDASGGGVDYSALIARIDRQLETVELPGIVNLDLDVEADCASF